MRTFFYFWAVLYSGIYCKPYFHSEDVVLLGKLSLAMDACGDVTI